MKITKEILNLIQYEGNVYELGIFRLLAEAKLTVEQLQDIQETIDEHMKTKLNGGEDDEVK